MNIRDLTYIQAVAKHGHFGQAAKACHVSQPALSSQIMKLEAELDVKLFERNNRSVRLTNIGRDIVRLASEALSIIENIKMTAQAAQNPLSGRFRVGFIPTIAPYLIPHFVAQSRDAFPLLNMEFQEDITERLNAALLSGDIDAAILATLPEDSKLEAIPLYDEPFWVIFPNAHALKLITGIKVKDLPLDELLLLTEGHCFRDQASDVCNIGRPSEVSTIQASSLTTLVNMVAAGQGVTLVPAMAIDSNWSQSGSVQVKKITDEKAYRRIYLTHRKSYPRRKLLDEMGRLICRNLPETIDLITA